MKYILSLKENIEEFGLIKPFTGFVNEEGKVEVIDGYIKYRALRMLQAEGDEREISVIVQD